MQSDMEIKISESGSVPFDGNGRYKVVAHKVPGVIDSVIINPGDLKVRNED